MLSSLILAAALAAAAPAAAVAPNNGTVEPSATVKKVTVVADKDKDDPVVCQSIGVTGSMFTERQCLHRSQWAQQARDGQDTYDSFSAGGAITKSH